MRQKRYHTDRFDGFLAMLESKAFRIASFIVMMHWLIGHLLHEFKP